ncbi:hypothetical protein QA649_24635 [Bradyrhizobium sp. CB1717]|uniref:hypothetical protein n=1 Tax=Bradyrhizobium sp. CB1717 TaxID=3039154 RepID=UPI0024B1A580|nr:hypothetical protein [Bradyrhizobium sp. CB1717]WFU21296.1 hypothetical protein QA649_24635 [Bradyrhizobium sp. CB1717]
MSAANPYRRHLILLIALAGLAGLVTATALILSLGIGGPISTALIGLISTIVGSAISFGAVTVHDARRQEEEIKAMRASLYAEIVDRVARCANDYIEPWRGWGTRKIVGEDAKFLPSLPLVLPAVAGKVGLLDAEVLLAVTQFYFRLSVLRDAIELVSNDPDTSEAIRLNRVNMIQKRFLSCFDPALRSLKLLEVPGWQQFDLEAAKVYPHLKKEAGSFREILERFAALAASENIV